MHSLYQLSLRRLHKFSNRISKYSIIQFFNQGEFYNPVSLHLTLQLIIYQCHFLHILILLGRMSNLLLSGMNTLSSYTS